MILCHGDMYEPPSTCTIYHRYVDLEMYIPDITLSYVNTYISRACMCIRFDMCVCVIGQPLPTCDDYYQNYPHPKASFSIFPTPKNHPFL